MNDYGMFNVAKDEHLFLQGRFRDNTMLYYNDISGRLKDVQSMNISNKDLSYTVDQSLLFDWVTLVAREVRK